MILKQEIKEKGIEVTNIYLKLANCEYIISENSNGYLEISKITDNSNHIQIIPISTNKFRVQ